MSFDERIGQSAIIARQPTDSSICGIPRFGLKIHSVDSGHIALPTMETTTDSAELATISKANNQTEVEKFCDESQQGPRA